MCVSYHKNISPILLLYASCVYINSIKIKLLNTFLVCKFPNPFRTFFLYWNFIMQNFITVTQFFAHKSCDKKESSKWNKSMGWFENPFKFMRRGGTISDWKYSKHTFKSDELLNAKKSKHGMNEGNWEWNSILISIFFHILLPPLQIEKAHWGKSRWCKM
jgi:hypothetical protein